MSSQDTRANAAARWGVGGLILFPAVAGVIVWKTSLGVADALFLALLMELLPALAVAQLPLVDEEERLPRVPVYLSSGAVILILGWGGLLLGVRRFGAEGMGLTNAPAELVASVTVGITALVLGLMVVVLLIRKAAGLHESWLLVQLLPETPREKIAFAGLSLAAGMGEELAYRGYGIRALTMLLGWDWAAALLSSAMFGVLHAYQGWLGILRTGLLGLILAGSFLISGSLWPAIIAHAIVDLTAGLVLDDILTKG